MRARLLSLKIALLVFFIGLLTATIFFTSSQFPQKENAGEANKNALVQYLELPLYFESNSGQLPSEIKYTTQRLGHSFYFTEHEIAIAVPIQKKQPEQKQEFSLLKMEFVKANQDLRLKGLDEQSCKSHYFIGNKSNQWHIDIPNYTKVIYENIYTGIDAVFYGNGQLLEYDLCVAPGADPNEVQMHFEGAKELTLDKEGNLHILTSADQQLFMQKPFIYQIKEEKKAEIFGEFVLLANNDIGFKIGQYDRNNSLIIDPILSYSTFLGGSGADFGLSLAIDNNGNAYVSGYAGSVNFPTTPGAFQGTLAGDIDIFISKINPTGTALIYSTYLGGSLNDLVNELQIDSSGNAYVSGSTLSTNYPITLGAFQTTPPGPGFNVFLTKLDATGSSLIFSTFLGGSGNFNQCASLALDSNGNSYITGLTTSTDFPVTPGAFQPTLNGAFNSFVTKFNSTGSALIYSTYLGGSQADQALRITVDSNDQAYTTGVTRSPDFPVTPGAFQTSLPGITSGYITKLNATGTALIYSTYLGGDDVDAPSGITVDNTGNAYIVGHSTSTNFPTTPGAFQTTFLGTQDAFALKLNATGTGLIYSTLLGGSVATQATSLALEPGGTIYFTGVTSSPDFPTTSDAFQSSLAGGQDIILTRLSADGSTLLYSTYMGGSGDDIGFGIALDGTGGVYIAGATASPNFPTTPGVFQPTLAGTNAAFIAKFQSSTLPPIVTVLSPNSGPESGGTVVTIIGSNFTGTTAVLFDSTAAIFEVINDTEIRAIAPPGTGIVQVTIHGPNGISAISPASAFTYLPGPPTGIFPPTHLKGVQKKNRFLSQTDYSNVLKWKAPKEGNSPIGYKIYRLPQLEKAIGNVLASFPLEFKDHNRKAGKTYTYLIIAVDEFGTPSAPASITVRPN